MGPKRKRGGADGVGDGSAIRGRAKRALPRNWHRSARTDTRGDACRSGRRQGSIEPQARRRAAQATR